MSSSQHVSPWPRYPRIPIFLDTKESHIIPPQYTEARNRPHVSSTPQMSSISTNRYFTFASPNPTRTASSFLKPPNSHPSRHFSRPYTPIEHSYTASSTSTPTPHTHNGPNATRGLGIMNGPTSMPSIAIQSLSDKRPESKSSGERKESKPDIAQRIEKRLWRYQSSKHVTARWLLEIISWIASALCMAAIIIMLLICKDKKMPSWPLGLTLNAYIAILSRISSTALVLPVAEALGQLKWSWFQGDSKKMWDFEIFDNASRGPWGSFLLLIRTKCQSLAALGALIVIFSISLDPFFQQVVAYPSMWDIQGVSSLPLVVRYKPQTETVYQAGTRVLVENRDLISVAEKFYYDNGTEPVPFGNGTRPNIPLSCPTSNCTWPEYDTLAVCSACTDISQLLTFDCLPTPIDWVSNLTGVIYTEPTVTACGYFLNATSDSPLLMSGYIVNANNGTKGEALVMRTLPLVSVPLRKPIFDGSINYKHVRNPIVDFIVVSGSNDSAAVYRNETPTAQECVISWCIKTLKSSYYYAKYEEEEKAIFLNHTSGPYPWKAERATFNGLNGTNTFYSENITIDASAQGHNTSAYGLSNSTQLQVTLIFNDIFPAVETVMNSTAAPYLRSLASNSGERKLLKGLPKNPWLAPNNVTNHIDKLAMALSDVIRSSQSKIMVNGTAYNKETYVAVRWAWLTLPISLLLLTLIFLVGTVMKSSKEIDQVGIWKTSAVATLLYGVPDGLKEQLAADSAMGTPRTKAKTLRVKLLPKKGWRASGGLFPPLTPKPRNQPPPGWI